MQLYSYWRSSTAYRVRIALQLKDVKHEIIPINLLEGEHQSKDFAALNPSKGIPCLQLEDGRVITQSMAIVQYLDRAYPTPPLLPTDAYEAARIEAASMVITTDIHPINNLNIGRRLKSMGHSQDDLVIWMNHWIREGLTSFHALIDDGPFCFGTEPTLADICLIPQLYNAHRWGTDLTGLERLLYIEKNCLSLAAFGRARPEAQPDAK